MKRQVFLLVTQSSSATGGPEDKDESHYPYVQTFEIGGMTCQNYVNQSNDSSLDSIEEHGPGVTLTY